MTEKLKQNNRRQKIASYSGFIAALIFIGSAQFANAAGAAATVAGWVGTAAGYVGFDFFGKIIFGLSYIVAWIGGVFIAIEAWLVGVMLGINQGIFQTVIVQKGFGVALSIANLGFVLGIIILALATILHNETYGYKKIIWKLVVAAILVNFSLVIMAPLFNLGNSFTQYFLNCIDPSVGCGNPSGLTFYESDNDFAMNLAGAFNPQNGFILPSSTQSQLSNPSSASLGGDLGQMMIPIFSMGFVALELAMICIVLGALVFMLLIRYLYITFLAILMPFAWLGWVFPSMKGWWSKWWESFIRWTFFPPIVVFFLWLALLSVHSMSDGQAIASQQFATYTSSGSALWGPMASFFTSFFTPIIQNILNIIVMLGLTVGGLIVADRIGITGAKAGVGAAQNIGKAVTNYVGKKTRSGARNVGDRIRGSGREYHAKSGQTTTRLQRLGSTLQSVPGFKGAGSAIARSNAPETIKHDREKDIQEFIDQNLKSLTDDGVKSRATSRTAFLNPVQAAAIAQELARRNLTTEAEIAPLMNKYVGVAERLGNLEKITANRPDLMPIREKSSGLMETKAEAAARAASSAKGDIVQANPDTFNRSTPKNGMTKDEVEAIMLALSPAQLATLGSDTSGGSKKRQDNLTNGFRGMINDLGLKKEIERREDEVDSAGKKTGKVIVIKTGKYELDSAEVQKQATTKPELENLVKIVKHMEGSSNWGTVLS